MPMQRRGFSFLLSIPVIAAAGAYGVLRMLMNKADIDWLQFSLAVALSALAGWLCIAAFLAFFNGLAWCLSLFIASHWVLPCFGSPFI